MSAAEIAVMVEKVALSRDLPSRFTVDARRLRSLLPDGAIRVQERLRQLAEEFADEAVYEAASTDLFKCVPVLTVHRWMTAPAWEQVDPRMYVLEAESSGDPAGFVRSTIPVGKVIFPRRHSWLIDSPAVLTLDSRQLGVALELLDEQQPPFVIFRLAAEGMRAFGVEIRRPNALDAAAAGQPQWNPEGLAIGQEYLDKDVPIEAVEELVWKP